LIFLSEKTNIMEQMKKDHSLLMSTLMSLNIEARYPKDKDELLKNLNYKKCSQLLKQTEDFYKWIKQLLKK
jgi:hypothetical protein